MANNNHYDVIIIGSGAGGGTLAHKLAPTGKQILILERGGYVPREKDNWNPRAVNLEGKYQTKEIWHDKDGKELHPHTNYYVGGNTKFFGAALFRLRKEDFGRIKHHGGLSPAWPITYDELEPYYTEAERLYHVHGNAGEDPIPADWRSNDHWFQHIAIVVSDMDKAYQHLRQHKIRHASTGPQTIPATNKAAAGIRAFYFKDADGHNLEIIYFPQGKGDPRWQQKRDKLFLGIDHTTIVVSNTQNSLKFYRDILGLKFAGGSMNYGPEQEHLNNVAGARLHISGLRASAGPGIEILEYLAPRDGRPAPKIRAPTICGTGKLPSRPLAPNALCEASTAAAGE